MSPTALRWGAGAAAGLASFYVAVLVGASGWSHLADQARADWWLLGPIVIGFAAQVALTVELRRRHRAHHLAATTGAGTGASAIGMVACCAHNLVESPRSPRSTAPRGPTRPGPATDPAATTAKELSASRRADRRRHRHPHPHPHRAR